MVSGLIRRKIDALRAYAYAASYLRPSAAGVSDAA